MSIMLCLCYSGNKIQKGNVWQFKQLRKIVQKIFWLLNASLSNRWTSWNPQNFYVNLPFYFTRCMPSKCVNIVGDMKNSEKYHKYQGEKHFSDFKIGVRVRNRRKKSYDKSWNLFDALRNRNLTDPGYNKT